MITKGIRILDKKSNIVSVTLSEILNEIDNGDQYVWSIIDLYAMGDLGKDISITEFEDVIQSSPNGYFMSWRELISFSNKLNLLINILVIGSKNKYLLVYNRDYRVMYETCNIVIEMIDSAFWEVFSLDEHYIDRLALKFKDVEFLKSDFRNA